MKRLVALIISLAFLAMLGLDSNACYFLMLTCDPVVDCAVVDEPEAPSCQFSCGAAEMACEPVVSDDTRVCVVPFTTETGFTQACNCDMAPPPFASTAAESKLLEPHTGNKLNMSFVLAPQGPTCFVRTGELNLSSIHPAIPTTVLRC